jgi:UDP-glucose 4-epimerase
VLEAVKAFELASGRTIPLHFAARWPGDVAACYADAARAAAEIGGKRSSASMPCAAICGAGSRRTPAGIPNL